MKSIIVCGFGRCGTSLMMQMLHAGGVECMGQYPDFECDEASVPIRKPFWQECKGKAVKVIDPHRFGLPSLHSDTLVIWMTRDRIQQSKSQAKLLQLATGIPCGAIQEALFRESYSRDESKVQAILPYRVTFQFENLILDTSNQANRLGFLIGSHFNITKAESVVIPRSTDCYPGFLEEVLLEREAV